MAAVPTVFIIINKIIEYSALINTGAELNMMIINMTDRAGRYEDACKNKDIVIFGAHKPLFRDNRECVDFGRFNYLPRKYLRDPVSTSIFCFRDVLSSFCTRITAI